MSAVVLGCDTNEAVKLNLQTLEADTEYGTLEAGRLDDSYVSAMGEGEAIGIVLPDECQWGCACVPPFTGSCCTFSF